MDGATELKRQAWARLQADAPDVAGLLTAVNRVFGKPAGVRVVVAVVVLIEAGSVELSGNEWDGTLRRPRYG